MFMFMFTHLALTNRGHSTKYFEKSIIQCFVRCVSVTSESITIPQDDSSPTYMYSQITIKSIRDWQNE